MRAKRTERLLSRELDRDLSGGALKELESELGASEELRETRTVWASYAALLGKVEDPNPPTAAAMRADVLRRIRLERDETVPEPSAFPSFLPARLAIGISALILVIGIGAWWWLGNGPAPVYSSMPNAAVEWVDTDIPDAMPVVYTDEGTGITVIWVESFAEHINHAGS